MIGGCHLDVKVAGICTILGDSERMFQSISSIILATLNQGVEGSIPSRPTLETRKSPSV